jgi:hypothetical protein
MKDIYKIEITSFLVWLYLSFVGKSLRWKSYGEEKLKELIDDNKSVILVTWHGRMFLPIYYLRNKEIYGIVSPSKDGKYFAKVFSKFGWRIISGSSRRGGIQALKSGIKILKNGGILAITPDGPTGPLCKVQPGVIYLSKASNSPIIPVGSSCSRKKFLKTWDKSLIPLPFGVGTMIFGEPMFVEEELNQDKIKKFQDFLKEKIDEFTKIADEIVGNKK